jgi:uncharacterized protein (DUF4415 family)
LRKELAKLEQLGTRGVDTSDIAEITDAEWARRQSGPLYRPIKKSVTLRIDADVLEWFRSRGPGYQTAINRILRSYFADNR